MSHTRVDRVSDHVTYPMMHLMSHTPVDRVSDHVTYPMMHLMSTPPIEQTDACENITFARFAMRVVIKQRGHNFNYLRFCTKTEHWLVSFEVSLFRVDEFAKFHEFNEK